MTASSRFYELRRPRSTDDCRYDLYFSKVESPHRPGDADPCPHCGGFTSLLRWRPPFIAELEIQGKLLGDLAFGPGDDMLISRRFLDLYLESGLTGLQGLEPVEIRKVIPRSKAKKAGPTEFFRALPSFSTAAVDEVASGIVRPPDSRRCAWCGGGRLEAVERGIVIDPATWTGEDVFEPRNLHGFRVVTQRFVDFCRKNELTNVTVIPAEDVRIDYRRSWSAEQH